MSMKLGLEEIENGWLITKSGSKVYREDLRLALVEVRTFIDIQEKELKKASKEA